MATLTLASNAPEPRLYISSYYALLGSSIFFKFDTPVLKDRKIIKVVLQTGEDGLTEDELKALELDLDPNTPILDNITYTYKNIGRFFISYTVTYENLMGPLQNSSVPSTSTETYFLDQPIIILEKWPTFSQQEIRILGENILQLPFSFEEIQINPNEFGVSTVYNSALKRLYDCLEFLKSNTSILNSKTPSLYYGWLGVNSLNIGNGLRWHTLNYLNEFYNNVTSSQQGFSNIKDIAETKELIFVLDDNTLKIYKNSDSPKEIIFSNLNEILLTLDNISSFDISEDGKLLFVLDSVQNRLLRIDVDFDATNSLYETYNPILSLTRSVGSYGDELDPFTFNNPIQVLYIKNHVYVLDYNNKCLKIYNDKLNWVSTIKPDILLNDDPISFAVQKDTNFIYVLTKQKIYVFKFKSNTIQSTFDISNLSELNPKKIFFDEAGEFFYIVTDSYVFKYTALGLYMDILDLPKESDEKKLTFISGKSGKNRNILLTTQTAIIKCQEVTEILKTGEGLNISYWVWDQIMIKPNEMAQDMVINKSLSRLVYNIINFRNSLEAKLLISSESTPAGIIEYFRLYPIKADSKPKLDADIENNLVAVGVNELHVPSVINRELKKLYDAILNLKLFLDVENVTTESEIGRNLDKCPNAFCWSWRAMSTYNLPKPIIRTCNINPISFRELQEKFINTDYTTTKTWQEATSDCCSKVKTPI